MSIGGWLAAAQDLGEAFQAAILYTWLPAPHLYSLPLLSGPVLAFGPWAVLSLSRDRLQLVSKHWS